MKKKGVKKEDKIRLLLDMFHQNAEIFNKNEVEKKGIKAGVRDALDIMALLIADDLVDTDKLGGGNFYWAFPSQAMIRLRTRKEKVEEEINKLQQTIHEKNEQMSKALSERKEMIGRQEKLDEIQSLTQVSQKQEQLIKQLKRNSKETYDNNLKNALIQQKQANEWTNNIFTVKSYLKSTFFQDEANINERYEIPDTLDEII